ncbi:MAG: calcium-binding protein, partial [Caldimonas sp.]
MSLKSTRHRVGAALRRARRAARAAPATVWRIETLEPKLLLSADAIPAVHLIVNDPPGGVANTYQYHAGDGADWVASYYDASPAKANTLQFEGAIRPADVVVSRVFDPRSGADVGLRLSIGGGDSVSIDAFFADDDPGNPRNPIQRVRFASDGTVWDLATLLRLAATGGPGNDVLRGSSAGEPFGGQAGNDVIDGGAGGDSIDGGLGDDLVTGGPGNNLYLFGKGDGQDTIRSYLDATPGKLNTLEFKSGVTPAEVGVARVDDAQWGVGAGLTLTIAGTGDSIIVNGFFQGGSPTSPHNGLQQVRFADGTLWDVSEILVRLGIGGSGGDDEAYGGAGNDLLNGGAGYDYLTENEPNGGDDTLFGGDDGDFLNGGDGNDVVLGGNGSDQLLGGYGNDVLDGGSGDDTLYDGNGLDTFLFGFGDGSDLVQTQGYNYDGSSVGTLQLKDGVTPADVALALVADDYYSGQALELTLVPTGDRFTVLGYSNPYGLGYGDGDNPYNPVHVIRFADGAAWTVADINAILQGGTPFPIYFSGTGADDSLSGSSAADVIEGDTGRDTLHGLAGNDDLSGSEGADLLFGDAGDDTLTGGDQDDTLDGGTGNDLLAGYDGNNTYRFGLGDGQDTIDSYYDPSPAKNNTLEFKPGIGPSDLLLAQVADPWWGLDVALEIGIAGRDDKVTVSAFFADPSIPVGYHGLQQLRFADGTLWDVAFVVERLEAGMAVDEAIVGTSGNDLLNGAGGDDTVSGLFGDDTLYGGSGNDHLYGGGANLNDEFGGNDLLLGGSGDDTLDGNWGDNLLDGGPGDDTLWTGLGSDTFRFGRGDGHDALRTLSYSSDVRVNTLQMKSGVLPSEVVLRQVVDNYYGGIGSLEVSIVGSADTFTVGSFFSFPGWQDDPSGPANPLQRIVFEDGTVWDLPRIEAIAFAGTAGDDELRGTIGADTVSGGLGDDAVDGAAGNDRVDGGDGGDYVQGGSGNDSLFGGAGNDLLDGGTGNDTIDGGVGNNLYNFARGGGQDVISSYLDATPGKLNILRLEGSILPSQVELVRVDDAQWGPGGALEVRILGSADKLTVSGFFAGGDPANANNPLQQIHFFADGTTWDIGYVLGIFAGNLALTGGPGNDLLTGGSGADTLRGGGGDDTLLGLGSNDSLYGEVGNDLLDGGAGNDFLDGGSGDNTVLFGRGDGQDTVTGNYDPTPGKLNTLQLRPGVLASELRLRQTFDPAYGANLSLEVAITGSSDAITFKLFFNVDDPASPYNPLQRIRFDDGTSWDLARIQAELFAGTAGDDDIRGTVANDALAGGAGNDTLNGAAGNDTLDGGTGNDSLDGGFGDNTYRFGIGDGQDTIRAGYDPSLTRTGTLLLEAGIAPADISLARVSDPQWGANAALELGIAGVADKVLLGGFFAGGTPAGPYNGVQQLKFADGTLWDVSFILGRLGLGTAGNDSIVGGTGVDLLNGAGGDDTLRGGTGADALYGGTGNDALYGEDGNDTVSGGVGADLLDGGLGDDVLDGGAGNDTLWSGTGSDSYLFGRGDGQDLLHYSYDPAAHLGTLQLRAGIAVGEVLIRQAPDSDFG